LTKQYEKIAKSVIEKERETVEYRKRERLILVDKKLMEPINHKQSQLGKKLELKDELFKKYEEQIKNLDKEMRALKLVTFDKDTEMKK